MNRFDLIIAAVVALPVVFSFLLPIGLKLISYFFAVLFGVLLVWTHILYPSFIRRMATRSPRKWMTDAGYLPTISFIIPTYNEADVIYSKLTNVLELDYPHGKMEVIIVDGRSADRTLEEVDRFTDIHKDLKVRVISQLRREGEYAGTNLALRSGLEGEIIIQSDADAMWKRDALRKVMRNFADKMVGGVATAHTRTYVGDENPMLELEKEYWAKENELWMAEALVDSCIQMQGEGMAWRNVVEQLEAVGSGDLAIAIQLREKGFRVVYEPEARVTEHMPSDTSDFFRQKRRRVYTGLEVILKLRRAMLNGRLGLYGLLILPTHRLLYMATPILALGFVAGLLSIVFL